MLTATLNDEYFPGRRAVELILCPSTGTPLLRTSTVSRESLQRVLKRNFKVIGQLSSDQHIF